MFEVSNGAGQRSVDSDVAFIGQGAGTHNQIIKIKSPRPFDSCIAAKDNGTGAARQGTVII